MKPETKMEAWSMEQENHLCKLWSCHPCLFDVKSKDFANKPMRKVALREIATELDRTGLKILSAYLFCQPIYSVCLSILSAYLFCQPIYSVSLSILSAYLFCLPIYSVCLSILSAYLFCQPIYTYIEGTL